MNKAIIIGDEELNPDHKALRLLNAYNKLEIKIVDLDTITDGEPKLLSSYEISIGKDNSLNVHSLGV